MTDWGSWTSDELAAASCSCLTRHVHVLVCVDICVDEPCACLCPLLSW